AERQFRHEFKEYVQTLSYRLKKSGTDVIEQLPFGIIIYNDEQLIEWHNPYIGQLFAQPLLIGEALTKVFPNLSQVKDREGQIETMINSRMYRLDFRTKDRILYVTDVTESWAIQKKYDEERLSLGI